MTRSHLRERLAALHLPHPPTLLGLSRPSTERYRRRAHALYRLSLGDSFLEAADPHGLSEFELAAIAARAIELEESGSNAYMACVMPLPRRPARTLRNSERIAPRSPPRSRKGTHSLVRAALVARVRGRIAACLTRADVEADVLAEFGNELRKVLDELYAWKHASSGIPFRYQEVRHD